MTSAPLGHLIVPGARGEHAERILCLTRSLMVLQPQRAAYTKHRTDKRTTVSFELVACQPTRPGHTSLSSPPERASLPHGDRTNHWVKLNHTPTCQRLSLLFPLAQQLALSKLPFLSFPLSLPDALHLAQGASDLRRPPLCGGGEDCCEGLERARNLWGEGVS